MADSRSKRPSPARRQPGGGGDGALGPLLLLVLLGALALAAPQLAIVVAAGLLPTIVAWIVQTEDQPHLAKCVAFMNLAGVIPVAAHLLRSGVGFGGLTRTLADPMLWAAMYGAAAIGWGLYLSIPPLAEAVARRRLDGEAQQLDRAQKELLREWGSEVTGAEPKG